ncbi:MAG: ABC transporter permease [Eubacteriales bacterium]
MILNILKISVKNLLSNKMRTFLTMLGIIIGISSIIAFITIGQGVTYAVIDQLSGLGGNRVSVSITNTRMKSGFTVAELSAFEAIDGVEGLSPSISSRKNVLLDPALTNSLYDETHFTGIRIMGINDNYYGATVKQDSLLYGRGITASDVDFSTNVCVLGYQVWKSLYGNYNPVGERLKIQNVEFVIVGVMGTLVGVDTSANTAVMVPYTVAMQTLGMGLVRTFDAIIRNTDDMQAAMLAIDELCTELMNDNRGYTVFNQQEVMDVVVSITDLALGMLAGIAAIALLVGGIGIMNMMLVTVTERTAEIGLRKALGAKPRVILLQFLMEAVIISVAGGVLGILLGLGLSYVASVLIGYAFGYRITTLLGATVFSLVLGIIFGILPARKAARLHPIDALRAV